MRVTEVAVTNGEGVQKSRQFCGRHTCIPPQENVCNATILDSLASLNESWGNGEDFQSALQTATMASDNEGRIAMHILTFSFTINVNEDNYCQYPTSRHFLSALNCPSRRTWPSRTRRCSRPSSCSAPSSSPTSSASSATARDTIQQVFLTTFK